MLLALSLVPLVSFPVVAHTLNMLIIDSIWESVSDIKHSSEYSEDM